jgi:hypothetical protein
MPTMTAARKAEIRMNDDNNCQEQNRVTGQIAIHKTDKKLLEFIDGLNPAPLQDYASLHAGAVRPYEKDGQRIYSVIRIVAQDYSSKGEPSVRAKANISPVEARHIYETVKSGAGEFKFEAVKIFGGSDGQGFCPMTKLWITRSKTTAEGEVLGRPWKVDVENGRGIKAQGKNGGAYCQGGSYALEKKVFLNFTDCEFFGLMCAVERYISIWEIAYGTKLIKEGRLARDAQISGGDGV